MEYCLMGLKIYFAGPLFTLPERIWNEKLSQSIESKINAKLFLPQDKVKEATDEKGDLDFKNI